MDIDQTYMYISMSWLVRQWSIMLCHIDLSIFPHTNFHGYCYLSVLTIGFYGFSRFKTRWLLKIVG